MSRDNGIADAQLLELEDYATSPHFDERLRTILEYADAVARTDRDVSDELFARVSALLPPDQLVEVTFTVAMESMLSSFHRALRIDAEGFCPIRLPARGRGAITTEREGASDE